MRFFLNQVTIIGLGLIGSSIARGLKEQQLARRIVGCSQSTNTLNKARALGIIDSAVSRPSDSVRRSELVMLCTPLSTYSDIASAIAPELKTTAILTDVGSVKKPVIDMVTPHLRRGQIFIPAHPIAGSEKSGVEAGSSHLFTGKKVIITPAAHHHSQAGAEKLVHLWETLGAHTEMMEASKHDSIYAAISHAIQLLSSTYASSISSTCPIEEAAHNPAFTGFIRLAGSNLSMWQDIFTYNHQAVTQALQLFTEKLSAFVFWLEQGNYDKLCQTIETTAAERAHHPDSTNTDIPKRSYAAENPLFACTVAAPLLIACAAYQAFPYTAYAGSGFFGFTQILKNSQAITAKRLLSHREQLLHTMQNFCATLHSMREKLPCPHDASFVTTWEKGFTYYQKLYR